MNYMGSKAKISKYIVPIIQQYIDLNSITTYIEPFVGGANVIDKIRCDRRIGSDANEYLIELFKFQQSHKDFPSDISYEDYCNVRTAYNMNSEIEYEKYYIGLVGFLASYNGRFFDGGFAKPTISDGKLRNYYQEHLRNLLYQNLDGIEFQCGDYHSFSEYIDCLIYCDPPYRNTKEYNSRIKFDSDEFFEFARKLSENNIVLISEQSAPDDFECIWKQSVKRQIDTSNKFDVCEKLFVYKYGKQIKIPTKRGLF